MKKFVRESKFRHVFGQGSPKDQQFEGINASTSRLDGNICAVNRKFIAVVLTSSGGGVFTVLSRGKPGRYEKVHRCIGHGSEIIDLSFDPFNPNRIISGAEDGSFIVWWIKDGGLDDDLSEYQCSIRGSQRRAVQAVWHPSAADIVFCVNTDSISIFDVEKAECLRTIDMSQYTEQAFNISLNLDGSQFAVACKDKKVRVFKTTDGSFVQELQVHEGSKPVRVAWLHSVGHGNFLATTGATKMSERQVCVWDLTKPNEPVSSENLDNASAVINLFYDYDTSLLALFSKGEVTVRLFEIESTGQIFITSVHQAQEPQRAGAFGNKLACNHLGNEIMHFVRVLSKSIEEVAFTVPRRSDLFQDDLFPDTQSEVPSLKASDFAAGKTAKPNTVCLKDYQPLDNPVIPNLSKATNTVGRVSSVAGTIHRPQSNPALSVGDIQEAINDLKSRLKEHEKRISDLEKR